MREIKVINARIIGVKCDPENIYAEYCNDKIRTINSITFPDDYTIKLGEVYKFTNKSNLELYRIARIERAMKSKLYSYILYTSVFTQTAYYLMPLLGHNCNWWEWDNRFVNAYIDAEDYFSFDYCIFLMYRIYPEGDHCALENKLLSHDLIIDRYPIDKYHVMYVFKFNDQWKDDYITFINGQYSKYSENAKRRICDFHKPKKSGDGKSFIERVLDKDESLRRELEIKLGAGGYRCPIPLSSELDDTPDFRNSDVFLSGMGLYEFYYE